MTQEQNLPPALPEPTQIVEWIVAALDDLKAVDVRVLDVRGRCNFADFMVFASGTSDRHLKSQAHNVVEKLRERGVRPMGVEGDDTAGTEWVLVDVTDVLVHIMLPETRDHYQLEKLWSAPAAGGAAPSAPAAYAGAMDKLRGGAR
ncbi:ribosome silencing factor [Halothiobacillus sp. DCM-1]|uniref:ribosome silencing factor n=1 Tax=Halothiobacillus sp. DCM-1 TaxID=3112558 RepID=UPI00324E8382